jgi:hypothetical protein
LILAETSEISPALASHNGRLFLAWRGSGNDQLNIAFAEFDPGGLLLRFTGKRVVEESERAPALASHNGHLHLAWTGLDERLNVAKVVLFGNTAGGFGIEGIEGKVILGETTEAAPALASHNGRLFLAWKGSGNDALSLAFSADGAAFTTRTFTETSSHGPSLASHSGRLFYSWKGSGNENLNIARVVLFGNTAGGFGIEGLDAKATLRDTSTVPRYSLGFVYIVETTALKSVTFDDFKGTILRQNAHLPSQFDYGGHYTFNGLDGRQITIWFELTGQKYTPRVVDLAEPVVDFSALALVSGEVMHSVGHRGVVEIQNSSGGQVVLTLDYESAGNPSRDDNKISVPAPWLDRVSALVAAARAFDDLGRKQDAREARSDAAQLYDELLRLDTERLGTPLAPIVIDALAAIGIDFSVPQNELLEWLADPDFTPYPAVAQALLRMGRKLLAPVFIDVISFKYDSTPDVTSPRAVGDIRGDVLRAAIVASSNERYGTSLSDTQFQELLHPQ